MAKPYIPYDGPIVTRQEAKSKKLTRYFPGTYCVNNHLCERLTSNGCCHFCLSERTAARHHQRWLDDPEFKSRKMKNNQERSVRLYKEDEVFREKSQRASLACWNIRKLDPVWLEENRKRNNIHTSNWSKKNPETVAQHQRNRRARKLSCEGVHTPQDIERIFKAQNGKCGYCRVSIKNGYHIDHIMALSKGGTNWPNNLQLLCGSCNVRKWAHDPMDYARKIGKLL